jgi:phosphoribosyl 1,2-cyclic phosphate phosphodiesterase
MIRANVRQLDAIVFTHAHKDHIAGLDDIRPYNFFSGNPVKIYATPETQEGLHREFNYIFSGINYPGIPQIEMHTINPDEPFFVNGVQFTPIKLLHYKMEVLGFRIGDFTYITDANYIAPEELSKVRGSKGITLNALRHEPHISHFTLAQAVELAKDLQAEETYFTHISHQLGLHDTVNSELPRGMNLAYDGLTLTY